MQEIVRRDACQHKLCRNAAPGADKDAPTNGLAEIDELDHERRKDHLPRICCGELTPGLAEVGFAKHEEEKEPRGRDAQHNDATAFDSRRADREELTADA